MYRAIIQVSFVISPTLWLSYVLFKGSKFIIMFYQLHAKLLQSINILLRQFNVYFDPTNYSQFINFVLSFQSLVHVLRNRKTITEPEVRYYLKQLIEGTKYTHGQNIIHRDLKLGNMLLNDNMNVKIADFGLATKVEYEGEKKM